MSNTTFFSRLKNYYLDVASALRGEIDAASIFPNTTDIGQSREKIYAEFLKLHSPSKCNVFLGGFLFDVNGNESKQLDVLVTVDTTPKFDMHNKDGGGKSFSPVEGCICVVSNKSMLNKNELYDALGGIASIPETESLDGRLSFTMKILDYDDWPYKVIFASDGLTGETILKHLNSFYLENPTIPIHRRPNLIHVAGKYVLMRAIPSMEVVSGNGGEVEQPEIGSYTLIERDPDLTGIMWVLNSLQQKASASSSILFQYGDILNKVQLSK